MIQPLFNGMLALLLAKFCLNDLPHAAGLTGTDYERPPTTAQLRYIAGLRQRLKMTITYERQIVTFGEAGRMIRELEAEDRNRKRLEGGNPGNAKLEAVVLKPSGPTDFYHVTPASRLDAIMNEGLRPPTGPQELTFAPWIMSEKLGRKEFFPATYLWGDDSDAYQFVDFLHEQKVTREPLAILRVDLKPGDVIYPDPDTPFIMVSSWMFFEAVPPSRISIIEQPETSNPIPVGTCYPDAWRFLIKQGEGYLIHGSVQLTAEGARINHAWVELPTGWIWEPQTKSYYTVEDFKVMSPIEEHRYTVEEAAIMVARTGNHGPWTEEERSMWLSQTNPGNPYPPRKGVIPKLPEEARGDILFYEYIRDLCKYEALSGEDVQRLWEDYKVQHGR